MDHYIFNNEPRTLIDSKDIMNDAVSSKLFNIKEDAPKLGIYSLAREPDYDISILSSQVVGAEEF